MFYPFFLAGKFQLTTGPFGIAQEYSEGEVGTETKFRKVAHLMLVCPCPLLVRFAAAFVRFPLWSCQKIFPQ